MKNFHIRIWWTEGEKTQEMVEHSGLDFTEICAAESFIENIKHNGTDEAAFDKYTKTIKDLLFGRYPPK